MFREDRGTSVSLFGTAVLRESVPGATVDSRNEEAAGARGYPTPSGRQQMVQP